MFPLPHGSPSMAGLLTWCFGVPREFPRDPGENYKASRDLDLVPLLFHSIGQRSH